MAHEIGQTVSIKLNKSQVNTLIASLMLTAISYDKPELKKAHPKEADKYRELEKDFRDLCYYKNKIATLECFSNFD